MSPPRRVRFPSPQWDGEVGAGSVILSSSRGSHGTASSSSSPAGDASDCPCGGFVHISRVTITTIDCEFYDILFEWEGGCPAQPVRERGATFFDVERMLDLVKREIATWN